MKKHKFYYLTAGLVALLFIASPASGLRWASTLEKARPQFGEGQLPARTIEPVTADVAPRRSLDKLDLHDRAFVKYVDLRLLPRAIANRNAAEVTDLALQLAFAESVLSRTHKALSAMEVTEFALASARETGDQVSLDRLARFAAKRNDAHLANRVATAKLQAAKVRIAEAPTIVPVASLDSVCHCADGAPKLTAHANGHASVVDAQSSRNGTFTAAQDNAAKKDQDSLQGDWQMVSSTVDGKSEPDEKVKACKLTFNGDKVTTVIAGRVVDESTFKLDPSKQPKAIDLTALAGPDAGKTVMGVYSIDGNQLIMCGPPSTGSRRPTELKPGKGLVYTVLQRAAPAPLKLTVLNETGKEIYLYSVKDGQPEPYQKLPPNQSSVVPAYQGQSFGALIKDGPKATEFVMPATDTTWHLQNPQNPFVAGRTVATSGTIAMGSTDAMGATDATTTTTAPPAAGSSAPVAAAAPPPALLKLNILNQTGQEVSIYYLDEDSQPVFYQKLLANQNNVYQSYEGMHWLAVPTGSQKQLQFVMPATEATFLLPGDKTTANTKTITGLNFDQLGKTIDEYTKDYKPVQLKGYTVGQETRFDITFTPDLDCHWEIRWDITAADYQKENQNWTSQGYRRTVFNSYKNAQGETLIAVVWEKCPPPTGPSTQAPPRDSATVSQIGQGWYVNIIRNGTPSRDGPYATQEQAQARLQVLIIQLQLQLRVIQQPPPNVMPPPAATPPPTPMPQPPPMPPPNMTPPPNVTPAPPPPRKTKNFSGLTPAQAIQEVNSNRRDYNPVQIKGYGVGNETRYDVILIENRICDYQTIIEATAAQYEQQNQTLTARGYRRTSLSTWTVGKDTIYAAVWEKCPQEGTPAVAGTAPKVVDAPEPDGDYLWNVWDSDETPLSFFVPFDPEPTDTHTGHTFFGSVDTEPVPQDPTNVGKGPLHGIGKAPPPAPTPPPPSIPKSPHHTNTALRPAPAPPPSKSPPHTNSFFRPPPPPPPEDGPDDGEDGIDPPDGNGEMMSHPGNDPGNDPGYDPGYGYDPGNDPGYDPGNDPGYGYAPSYDYDPGYDYDSGYDGDYGGGDDDGGGGDD